MASISWALLVLSVIARALALPGSGELVGRQQRGGAGASGKSGQAAPSYSSSWTDGAKMNYKTGSGGSYTVSWSGNNGNFVVGRGWSPGNPR